MSEPWKKYGTPWTKYGKTAPEIPQEPQQPTPQEPNGYQSAITAPGELMRAGIAASQGNAKFGKNPFAGAGYIGNAGLSAGLAPFSAMGQAVKDVPILGPPTEWLLGLIPRGISAAAEPVGRGFARGVGTIAGLPEAKIKEAENAWGGLVSNAATAYMTPPLMEKALSLPSTIQESAGTASKVIAAKAHQPPFSIAKGIEQFDRQLNTVIGENLPPTRKGLQKTSDLLNNLDNVSRPLREQATQSGTKVDFEAYKQALENQKSNYTNDADFAEKSRALDDMISRVDAVGSQYPNGEVPLNTAWKFKQSLQKMVGGKYDEVAGYSKEAAKTSAHLLLDDIISKVPQLREIGLRQRDLIEAQNMQSRRVAALDKSNPWNRRARAALTGSGVGIFSHDPALALGVGTAEYLTESPRAQHVTAVALDRLSKLGKGKTNPYSGYTPTPFPTRGNPGNTGQVMSPPPTFPTQAVSTRVPPIINPTAGLSTAGEIGNIDIRKLALRPEETKLPPLSTIEEDVAGIQNTPGMREMMIRRLGPESANFTDEQLARAYRAKSSAYLNEATPEEINRLRASGRITQRAATQAINTKTGTANQQTIESLKQQIANKSSEDMMTPKSGTTEDFVAYRKYISSGGNLNFSDWKSSGKPIK